MEEAHPMVIDAAIDAFRALIVAGDRYRLAAAHHFGLDLPDTYAISFLHAHGPMPQSGLAKCMGLSSGGTTGLVDRLERGGIVRRTADPLDRRRHQLQLTERAIDILDESRARLLAAFDGMDPAYVRALAGALPLLAAGLVDQSDRMEHALCEHRASVGPTTDRGQDDRSGGPPRRGARRPRR